MARRSTSVLAMVVGIATAALAQPRPGVVPGPVVGPWVTSSCWLERRWFETLRSGPVDFCKRSLRFRPGHVDCVVFSDEVCWVVNTQTGEWQLLRTPRLDSLIPCPEGPEPPTCPRLR
jgi:hypothetical protein